MFNRILNVSFETDMIAICEFYDGSIRKYDFKQLFNKYPIFKRLKNEPFLFENGKVAKVPMESYITKLNRKKLTNAYGAASPLANALFISEDRDVLITANSGKFLVADTKDIPLKTTRHTQGVQVMKLTKKGAKMIRVSKADESGVENLKYYTTKNIPAVGSFLKKDDTKDMQISLFED